MSDGENVDPLDIEEDDDDDGDDGDDDDMDNRSSVSSAPSEQPSTRRAWEALGEGREMTHGLEGEEGFLGRSRFPIHEDAGDRGDEEEEEGADGASWWLKGASGR